jgi:methyl-accepting chemotaxis protein
MLPSLLRRSLRARLLAGYGLLAALCLALGGGGLVLTGSTQARLATVYADRVLPLQQLPAVRFKLTRASSRPAAEAVALRQSADSSWRAYLATSLTPEETRIVERARVHVAAAWAAVERGPLDSAGRQAVDAAQHDLTALIDLQVRVAGAEDAAARAAYARGRWAVLLATATAAALALVLGLRMARHVCDGLADVRDRAESLRDHCAAGLAEALTAISRGDLSVELTPRTTPVPVRGADEIAALGTAVNSLIAQFRTSLAAYGETRVAVGDTVAGAKELAAAAARGDLATRADASRFAGAYGELVGTMNGLLDAVGAPIGEASTVLGRVAARDLTARMDGTYAGEFAAIQRAVNTAAENLGGALTEVAGGAAQVAAASGQIAGGSQSLAANASEQAASLERSAPTCTRWAPWPSRAPTTRTRRAPSPTARGPARPRGWRASAGCRPRWATSGRRARRRPRSSAPSTRSRSRRTCWR